MPGAFLERSRLVTLASTTSDHTLGGFTMENKTATFAGLGLVGAGGVVLAGALAGWFGDDELPAEEHSPVIAASTSGSESPSPSSGADESSSTSDASSSAAPSSPSASSEPESKSSTSRSSTSEPAPESSTSESSADPTSTSTRSTPSSAPSPTAAPAPGDTATPDARPSAPKESSASTPAPTSSEPAPEPPCTSAPAPSSPAPRTPAPRPSAPGNPAQPGDPVAAPARLSIPGIDFDENVSEVGLTSKGTLNPPPGITGWYGDTVKPGENGISVIVGHVTYGPPDVFYHLPEVNVGETFTTTDADGRTREWKVDLVEHIDKVQLSQDERIWGSSDTPKLALVTCDPDTPRTDGRSAVNVFVLASPA